MPIYDTPRGWKIRNVKGYHRSKAAANRRLRAIKASQAQKKGKRVSHDKTASNAISAQIWS